MAREKERDRRERCERVSPLKLCLFVCGRKEGSERIEGWMETSDDEDNGERRERDELGGKETIQERESETRVERVAPPGGRRAHCSPRSQETHMVGVCCLLLFVDFNSRTLTVCHSRDISK